MNYSVEAKDGALQGLISLEHDQFLRRERTLLENLRVYLARLNAPDDDQALLQRTLAQLDGTLFAGGRGRI